MFTLKNLARKGLWVNNIGWGNSMSPVWCQLPSHYLLTRIDQLSVGLDPLRTNFSNIWIEISDVSFMKVNLKVLCKAMPRKKIGPDLAARVSVESLHLWSLKGCPFKENNVYSVFVSSTWSHLTSAQINIKNFKYYLPSPSCPCVYVNTLKLGQNGRHFADGVFKCIFVSENIWISIRISLNFVRKGRINNIPTLVQNFR